jgi:LuxR family maltose regulon positive regulatory protein
VELWSGRLDEAARVLDSGVTAAVASGAEHTRIDCLSHLALAEALRGRLGRAARLAGEATALGTGGGHGPQGQHVKPAALVALAWVHLEHHELGAARDRLAQADAALRASPDRLIGAVACLAAAYGALAEGRAGVATRFVARARSVWSVPSWLEQRLSLAESRALAAGRPGRFPAASQAPHESAIPAVEPLTEREREVLRHVSVMLTTAEIASELYISTNTVKSHIKNICHKLAATHRGEAVRRARQLQLI